MGSELRVGDIMTKSVVVVPFGKTILDVAKLMKKHDIGAIIVVEDSAGKHAKGIITERDLVQKILAKGAEPYPIKVEEVMARPLRVIHPDSLLEDAARAMKENKIKRLPVVNDHNELVGIITEGDIMKAFPAIVDLLEERSAIGK